MTAHDDTAGLASADDWQIVQRVRDGDEAAFETLVSRYHALMLRLALIYAPGAAVAEEIVQETWIGVLRGLPNFAGRSSLKTWIISILINRARTHAKRESRYVSFESSLDDDEPAVPAEDFIPAGQRWAGHWNQFPSDWNELPEERLLSRETLDLIRQEIGALPTNQREVITLRDVEGWSSAEVCNVLGISETNQRVLLHRARSKVRRALAAYLTL